MIVEILCGGYGCPTKTGVHTVSRGERCEVSDAEAARLIGLGVAKYVFSAPTAPETAPADVPATAEGNATPLTRKPRRAARRRPPLPSTSCAA